MAATTPSKRALSRPGLDKPLNWSEDELFPNALDGMDASESESHYIPLTTMRELTMLQIMNTITDKPGWEEKVLDESIASKWKAEAIAAESTDVTPKMMDWVIDELRYKVKIFKATGAISVYNGDVVKSDIAIPSDLKASLRAAIRDLEDIPAVHRDYHPGSDGQVLDLVHPSLFPLIYGRSRVVKDRLIGLQECLDMIGTGSTIPVPGEEETKLSISRPRGIRDAIPQNAETPYSQNYQWLPCELDISNGQAKITSYINNLHPKRHGSLYNVIEKIIDRVIPLWNMTLSPLADGLNGSERKSIQRITLRGSIEFDPDPDAMEESEKPQQAAGETEDDYYERIWEWENDIRRAVLPEPGIFTEPMDGVFDPLDPQQPPDFGIDLVKKFADKGLQIIVKFANIELTPENPDYGGGSWHVEGQLNEHICATALYYYDNENITDSYLAFRQQCSTEDAEEVYYPQNVHGWVREIYGIEPDSPAVQDVGAVLCREDRLLTFPNVLQHRVQPFTLADPSKPGHRKILALFLVDPHLHIISTANVPPQQRDWWSEGVEKIFNNTGKALGKLSTELKDKVYEGVDDFPIGLSEAKEIRLKLMDERRSYTILQNNCFESHEISLCEH